MKKTALVFFTSFLFVFGKAQYVTIPDSFFVQYLQQFYPNCMNGNQMDTTCADIVQAQNVIIQSNFMADGFGLQFFDNALVFNISYMDSLRSIPAFPSQLQWLYILAAPLLDSIPPLPGSLTTLSVNMTDVRYPPVIPQGVTQMLFDNCPMAYAPNLPSGLLDLSLSFDSLLVLPSLPPFLNHLIVTGNRLTSLPQIPPTLLTLRCDRNQLSSLPVLPDALQNLGFYDNQITAIDSFPDSLSFLHCGNNLIACFPPLPDPPGFWGVISGGTTSCLPNYTSWMAVTDPAALSIPLCSPANPSGCPVVPGVSGRVYQETGTNCVADSGESFLYNIPFRLYDTLGVLLEQAGSAVSGSFMFTPDTGNFEIRLDTSAFPLAQTLCPAGISRNVTLSAAAPSAVVADFDLQCLGGYDPGVQNIAYAGLVFSGQQHMVVCSAGDLLKQYGLNCSSGESGQIRLVLSGPVTFFNSLPGFPTPVVNGDTLTFAVGDFGSFSPLQSIAFYLETDTLAQIGDTVCIQASVNGTGNDLNPANNVLSYCYPALNSYDPNKKEVFPASVLPGYSGWLTYTVHFQNNGTAAAINIGIVDTLSPLFDMSSFEFLGASHIYTYSVINNVIRVRFPNIMLADSATNYAASQGWFQFRIKPAGNYPAGTVIPNSAAIYFDYNPPIITNTSTVSYTAPIGINENQNLFSLNAYPNPAHDVFTITSNREISDGKLLLISATGQTVKSLPFSGTLATVDVSGLAAGVYVVLLNDAQQSSRIRLVVY